MTKASSRELNSLPCISKKIPLKPRVRKQGSAFYPRFFSFSPSVTEEWYSANPSDTKFDGCWKWSWQTPKALQKFLNALEHLLPLKHSWQRVFERPRRIEDNNPLMTAWSRISVTLTISATESNISHSLAPLISSFCQEQHRNRSNRTQKLLAQTTRKWNVCLKVPSFFQMLEMHMQTKRSQESGWRKTYPMVAGCVRRCPGQKLEGTKTQKKDALAPALPLGLQPPNPKTLPRYTRFLMEVPRSLFLISRLLT